MGSTIPAPEPATLRLDFKPMRQRRRLLDISQARLSLLIGLHPNEVGYYERGQRVPRATTLVKLALALGTPIHDLFDVVGPDGAAIDFRKVRPS